MKLKTADEKSAKIVLTPKCGDCVHFKNYPYYNKPCEKLGVMKHRPAPDCFTPNVFSLQKISADTLNQIGLLFKDFTPSMARITLALISKRKLFNNLNLAFGMPVYFHLGGDYLNNYYRGYVIGVSSKGKKLVYITSDMNKKQVSSPAMLALFPDSVYNVLEFKKKKQELIDKGRLNDPKSLFLAGKKKKPEATVDYEPPTMESVPPSWFDVYSQAGKEKTPFTRTKDGVETRINTK